MQLYSSSRQTVLSRLSTQAAGQDPVTHGDEASTWGI